MNIDYTKLLPAQLRSTRWADILTVVGSILEDVKVNNIDIIKAQNRIMEMTDDQLISFASNFGYSITSLEGYTATIDYLRKEVYTIVPRILNRTTILGYNTIFTIFNLRGSVYPTTYEISTQILTPYESWLTSDEVADLDPYTLDNDGDFILFNVPVGTIEDLLFLDTGGATLDGEIAVYDDPAHSLEPAITLDDDNFLTLDRTSVFDYITRHLVIQYAFMYAENATEFLSLDTVRAFYNDVLNQKRKTELIYYEPLLEIETYAQDTLDFASFNGPVLAILFQSDGKLLVGGAFTTYDGVDCPKYFCRLNQDGSLDTTFNSAVGGGFDTAVYAIALQSDGKILVGGDFTLYTDTTGLLTSCPARMCRLNTDGTLDKSFNYGVGFGFDASIHTLAVQSSGRIVVGGSFTQYVDSTGTLTDCPVGLCQVNEIGGRLDKSFNYGTGLGFSGGSSTVYSIVIQSDTKILVGGDFTTYTDGAATATSCPDYLCRVNAITGLLDQTFNYGVGTGFDGVVYSVALQTDGNILAGGNFTQYTDSTGTLTDCSNKLCRVDTVGKLDQTFNYGAGQGFDNIIYSVALQTDGKILAGGDFTEYTDSTGTLTSCPDGFCRIETATGLLDQTFNYGVGTGFNNQVYAVAFQTNNRLFAGGTFTTYNGGACDNMLAMLNTVGALKLTEGILTTNTFYNYDHSVVTYINSFLLQPSLATVSKIRFGDNAHSVIDESISDVNNFVKEVLISNCSIAVSSSIRLNGRRLITQKCSFIDFTEIALLDASNVCLYYASFPKIQYTHNMYSNIAFDITIV